MFLMRTWVSDMSKTSRLPNKGLGGLEAVLQLISNHEPMEQPDPTPMPNGYGTVRLPHLSGQPGLLTMKPLVVVLVAVAVVLVDVVLVPNVACANRSQDRHKNRLRDMFKDGYREGA